MVRAVVALHRIHPDARHQPADPLPHDDGRWAFEVNWDGWQALVTVDGAVIVHTRRGGTPQPTSLLAFGSPMSATVIRPRSS